MNCALAVAVEILCGWHREEDKAWKGYCGLRKTDKNFERKKATVYTVIYSTVYTVNIIYAD